ncbi:MAG: NF038122 family metalloprotease, partial [Verrucomicrobiota bacterium]
NSYSYSSYRAALKSRASSLYDANAISKLPNSANDPVIGGAQINLTTALARRMGLSTVYGPDGFDSTVAFNMPLMNLTRPPGSPTQYDLQQVVEHEIDEVLGTSSNVKNFSPIRAIDLFRYTTNLARSYTTNGDNAYFSVDGTNLLARFNMNSGGDYSDFWSSTGFWAPTGITPSPQVQDAFATPGTALDLGINELAMLDVIGWTLSASGNALLNPPTVAFTSPAPGAVLSDSPVQMVAGTASDNTAAIGSVRVRLVRSSDGAWFDFVTTNWGSTTFDLNRDVLTASGTANWSRQLPGLPNGNYSVQAQAVDVYTHTSLWQAVTFTLTVAAPVVTFNPLTNTATVFDFSQIGGTANNGATVTFRIQQYEAAGTNDPYWDGTAFVANSVYLPATVSGGNWLPANGVTLPTRGQTRYGAYFLRAIASDAGGNASTNEILVSRSAPDTTPPELSFFTPNDGQVFTNNFLPFFGGVSSDPETQLAAVDLYFFRLVAPGQYQYWNGTTWVGYSTNLVTAYNNSIWSAPSGYSFPSGANLPNGSYSVQLSARNNEVPASIVSISAQFSVDYHPVYLWTAGSFSDADPNNNNNRWDNPANWNPYGVPPPEAIVVINGGSPDNLSVGVTNIYGINLMSGNLITTNMVVKKFNFSGGQLNAPVITIPTNGVFNISGSNDKVLATNTIINNNGTTLWTNTGNLNGQFGTVFNNNGLFRVEGDSQFYNNSGGSPSPIFNNYGRFEKAVATNVTVVSSANGGWVFNHYGTIDIQSGVLSLQGFANFQNGSIFSGAGSTVIASGTTTIFGTNTLNGGHVELAGGTLSGTGVFVSNGTFHWSTGTIAGFPTIAAGANFAIQGNSDKALVGTITNAGNATWTGSGWVNCRYGSLFYNTGLFTALNDSQFYNNSGGTPNPVFINTGTFTKSTGTNTTVFANPNGGVSFANNGQIFVSSGVLSLGGGGSSSNGSFQTASGTRVDLASGLHDWTTDMSIGGNGITRIAGATVHLNNCTNIINSGATLEVASGKVEGTGTLTGNGTASWKGGNLSGILNLTSNLTMNISGADGKYLELGTLNNAGTIIWTGAGQILGTYNSVLNNTGVFEMQNNSQFYNYSGSSPVPIINNSGTLRKRIATGQSDVTAQNGGWTLNNTGLIDVQSGVLSAQSQFNVNAGGSFSGGGITRVDGATATMNGSNNIVAGGTFEFASGTLTGMGMFNGPGAFVWSGGNIAGTNGIGTNGNLFISGSNTKTLTGIFTSSGTAFWTGVGNVNCNANSIFQNSGNFRAQNGAQFFNYSGSAPVPRFKNSGTFVKNGSTNATEFALANGGVAFDNTGLVSSETGTLFLNGGGISSNATFAATAGARSEFSGGAHSFSGGLNFSGGGIHRLSGATITALGGTNAIASGSTFEVASGNLAGNGAVSGPGTLSWTGGNISAVLDLLSNLTISLNGAADKVLSGGTLNNAGNIIWTGAGILMASANSVINNTGTFNLQNDSQFFNYSGSSPIPVFNNTGTLRKSVAGGSTIIQPSNSGWIFNNAGLFDIQTGILSCRSQLNLNAGGSYSGAGATRNEGGTATITGSSTIVSGSSFELASGTFNGTGTFNGVGTFVWTGGTFSGVLTIASTANLLMSGNTDRTLTGTLNNAGTATWTNNSVIYVSSGSVFNNSGIFLAQNESSFFNNTGGTVPLFNNTGTLRKTTATTTTFANANSGINFTNSGTVDLRAGTLAINAGYFPSANSQLNIVLTGTTPITQFGREIFPGNASVTGTLQITLNNGFIPTNGSSFDIVGYTARTGQFSATQFPPLPVESKWKLTYNPSSIVLQVVPGDIFQSASLTNGLFQVTFTGQTGSACMVEVSTNLVNWSPLLTNSPFNGTLNIMDPQTRQIGQRFFRATIFP